MLDAFEDKPKGRAHRARTPARDEVDPAALELLERHGPAILRAARRYSQTAEDAEDAYQRGLEILLTKAPSTEEDDLVPWLKTVVKHEAFALRRQREEQCAGGGEALEWVSAPDSTDEQAERRERLRVGAEAMSRLKPHEHRCLLLLAEGFSYRQICEVTGWTYTKVNRLATEGRRAFRTRVERIESGGECERLAAKLSALADGEASPDDVGLLRRHLRGCPACRLTLGEFRAMPARVCALTPPLVAATGRSEGSSSGPLSSALDWIQERAYALVMKVQAMFEAATVNKTAAVAASTAVLATGGIGAVKSLERGPGEGKERSSAARNPQAGRPAPPERLEPPASLRRPRAGSRPTTRRRERPRGAGSPSGSSSRDRSASTTGGGSSGSQAEGGEFSGPEAYSSKASTSSASSSTTNQEFRSGFESSRPSSGAPARASSSDGEFGSR